MSTCPHGAWSPASCPNCLSNSPESRESRSTLRHALTTALVTACVWTLVLLFWLWPDVVLFIMTLVGALVVFTMGGLVLYRLSVNRHV